MSPTNLSNIPAVGLSGIVPLASLSGITSNQMATKEKAILDGAPTGVVFTASSTPSISGGVLSIGTNDLGGSSLDGAAVTGIVGTVISTGNCATATSAGSAPLETLTGTAFNLAGTNAVQAAQTPGGGGITGADATNIVHTIVDPAFLATSNAMATATNAAIDDATQRVAAAGYLLPVSTQTIAGASVSGAVPSASTAEDFIAWTNGTLLKAGSGASSLRSGSVILGASAQGNGYYNIALGIGATSHVSNVGYYNIAIGGYSLIDGANSQQTIAIGGQSRANGRYSTALGALASCLATNATQLGQGTNSTDDSLQFLDYLLLTNGTIPLARLSGITSNQMAATEKTILDRAVTNGQSGVSLSGTTTLTNLVVNGSITQTVAAATNFLAGSMGIGTNAPAAKLGMLASTDNASEDILRLTSNNGTVGLAVGYDTFRTFGAATDLTLKLEAKGSGRVNVVNSAFQVDEYSYLGGLRILGSDGNTIYQEADIGISNNGGNNGLVIVQTGGGYFKGGNFGIAATSPGSTLDVNGSVLIRTNLTCNQVLYFKTNSVVSAPAAGYGGMYIDAATNYWFWHSTGIWTNKLW
jgi:hypothetical protein